MSALASTYNEKVLALQTGDVLEGALDTLRNLLLVLIAGRQDLR